MMLYICKHCGKWILSLGLAEAIATAQGATMTQACPDCAAPMTMFKDSDKVRLREENSARRGPSDRRNFHQH